MGLRRQVPPCDVKSFFHLTVHEAWIMPRRCTWRAVWLVCGSTFVCTTLSRTKFKKLSATTAMKSKYSLICFTKFCQKLLSTMRLIWMLSCSWSLVTGTCRWRLSDVRYWHGSLLTVQDRKSVRQALSSHWNCLSAERQVYKHRGDNKGWLIPFVIVPMKSHFFCREYGLLDKQNVTTNQVGINKNSSPGAQKQMILADKVPEAYFWCSKLVLHPLCDAKVVLMYAEHLNANTTIQEFKQWGQTHVWRQANKHWFLTWLMLQGFVLDYADLVLFPRMKNSIKARTLERDCLGWSAVRK